VAATQRLHHRKVGRSSEANLGQATRQLQPLRFVEKIPIGQLGVDAKAVERGPALIQVELVNEVFAQVDVNISDAVSMLHVVSTSTRRAGTRRGCRDSASSASARALCADGSNQSTDDSAVDLASPPRAPTVETSIAPKCAADPE
jgi:hypothetical protein